MGPSAGQGWMRSWPSEATPTACFLDYVGHGDSDKPLDHPYSTYERADLVEALWRTRSVQATVVVAFDYSCIVGLELLARRIERRRAGEDPGTVIHTCLLANGGLFAEGHTHPWFTTPLFKSRAGGPLMRAGQHSRRAFAPVFRPCSPARIASPRRRSSRLTGRSAGATGSAYCPPRPPSSTSTASTPNAGTWPASPRSSVEQCVSTSSEAARTDSRHGNCAWPGSDSAMRSESTELPGGHLATAEQPRRLAELIEGLR